MADGARQSNCALPLGGPSDGIAYALAEILSAYSAIDAMNMLRFVSHGDGKLEVISDWTNELYLTYGAPDGTYYLVREKK